MTILGGDYSHWNDPNFLALAAAGHRFCWLKCTEGISFVDPRYSAHRTGAQKSSMKTGAYHYFRAAWGGDTQAQHFFDNAFNDALPPAIDVERYNNSGFTKSTFAARLRLCLLGVEQRFGKKPIIYTSKYAWEELVGLAGWEDEYDLWVAHYTSALMPLLPNGWTDYEVWQFTSTPLDTNRMVPAYWSNILGSPPVEDTVMITIKKTTAENLKEALG